MASSVSEIAVALPHPALQGADWADAYAVTVDTPFANARAAGDAAFSTFPFWVSALMGARNMIMAPFGLKTEDDKTTKNRVGFFPVIDETETTLVVGMDDRHLDFRCVIDIANFDLGQNVSIATIIRRHNRLGRIYLATILPFHRLIVRSALARVARSGRN